MVTYPHILKIFIIIDHAAQTLQKLQADDYEEPIPQYKDSAMAAWQEMKTTAMTMMTKEWLWEPDMNLEQVRRNLFGTYTQNQNKKPGSKTPVDHMIHDEMEEYVGDVFSSKKGEVTFTYKATVPEPEEGFIGIDNDRITFHATLRGTTETFIAKDLLKSFHTVAVKNDLAYREAKANEKAIIEVKVMLDDTKLIDAYEVEIIPCKEIKWGLDFMLKADSQLVSFDLDDKYYEHFLAKRTAYPDDPVRTITVYNNRDDYKHLYYTLDPDL